MIFLFYFNRLNCLDRGTNIYINMDIILLYYFIQIRILEHCIEYSQESLEAVVTNKIYKIKI